MRYFPHIPRTVRTGTYSSTTHPSRSSRCPELASSYCLCHYRPTSACFATACILLPVACPPLQLARRSSLPAAPACPPLCPPFCLLCLLCLLCRSAALPLCLLQSACLQKKRDFEKSRFFIIRFGPSSAPPPRLSARQSRKPSRTSCSRILAQSATGCFSPSMNRSGHPRLQSSM